MLNQLLDDLMKTGNLSVFQDETYQKRFKELLGHEPLETFCGTLFGILLPLSMNYGRSYLELLMSKSCFECWF